MLTQLDKKLAETRDTHQESARAAQSVHTSAPDSFQVAAPSITLPKGGGAIRGIGEKFAANPVTGTGSMTVPIATSPGRSGFGPQLALSYDSGTGNGPFGFGWNLSLPSITRKTDKGLPQYQDATESDVFILSGGEDLVPVLNDDGTRWSQTRRLDGIEYQIHRYRPRIEGLFARIERWTSHRNDDVHWRSISKDNILTLYGRDANSRIADPEDPNRIFRWLICQTRDDRGNAVLYEYKLEDGVGVDLSQAHERNRGDRNNLRRTANRYLKRIRYGNRVSLLDNTGQRPSLLTAPQIENAGWMFEVVFDYGEHDTGAPKPHEAGPWPHRDDPFSTYRAGFEVRTTRLCRRVLMFHHFEGEAGVGNECLVRSTDFTYSHEHDPANARNPVYTFLLAVTQTGYKRDNGGYLKRSLPSVEFEYSQPIVQDKLQDVDAESLENLPMGLDGAAYQWTDLHGEGIPGILTEQAGAWFYKRNLSPINVKSDNGAAHTEAKFAPVETVAVKPNLALAAGQAQFMDLTGDGQPDLVVLDGPMPGLYEHDGDQGWQSFRPFLSRLNRDTRDPNLKFVDLNGDGHADVLISEDEAFIWHASLAEQGFGPAHRVHQALDEEKGPRLVFADGTQSIYLADFSGDGLTDVVRIRNGEVCYWPNLGYGRFGAKVTMDHAPCFDHPDQFDHQRIRLADIDGTGTTDIIYLHRDGVRLYFNQSGNSWSEPQVLRIFPRVDELAAIMPVDLLGNGTACLVWSSPLPGDTRRQMRYVDLMGGQKPHLLVKAVNNLGAETYVHYAPSTKFYLQDKLAGKPWITKLPFPVHVVEGVETFDRISGNRFVTRYAYHHGYFDGVEREFRGFGMVEQFDTEEIATLGAAGTLPEAANLDAASHVPPVHAKTWFHTGMYLGRDHVSNYFAGLLDAQDQGEYYRELGLTDAQAKELLLDDTVLPSGLTVEEEREACRALKGTMLRQEVYALDGTEKEAHPYVVTEQNFTVRRVQPHHGNRHAVFFTHAREALNYHYERDPADPRVQHALTLEVDGFGNVLKQAAIGYGRRQADPSLPLQADRDKQTKTLLTYTENRVTNAIDTAEDHRAPLPCETRTYELTGYAATGAAGRFQDADFVQPDLAHPEAFMHVFDSEVDYEAQPTGGKQRRLIEQVRTIYRRNDLTAFLALGALESLALPGQSYKLAFTPGLLSEVYGERISNSMLETEGRYVHSEGDTNWWIPSGQIFYSSDALDQPAQELAPARQHFFLPRRFRDPFQQDTAITYDVHDFFVTETRDGLGNRVTALNDYRVLQPRSVTDPNGNRAEVAFDTLGMVVGTAAMGKVDEHKGDSLDGFAPDLDEATILAHLANPFADPHGLVQRATSRLVYDLFAFRRTQNEPQPQPAVVYTLARETHEADLLPGQQTKIQHGFSYSDGFGREIQKKIQAEPGPLVPGGAESSPRWVGSGWTIFNNKNKPVRQYEPFFSATHEFENAKIVGVSPVLFYDPIGRVVATLHPNHTWEKVLFDPWRQETWDVNDTVLEADPKNDVQVGDFFKRLPETEYLPTWYGQRAQGAMGTEEQMAAVKAEAHAGTPTIAHADTLGQSFLTIAHNRLERNGTAVDDLYTTRVDLDIEGNQRTVRDALDRIVMRYDYDLLGMQIHSASMEAGERWMLNDVAGKPMYGWDSRNHRLRTTYDELRRPTEVYLQEGIEPELLVGRTVYGETQLDPEASNLRGKAYQSFDGAGIVTSEEYDFKGNVLRSSRQLAVEYKKTVDWSKAVALESAVFIASTMFDALNRPVTLTTPDKSVIRPTYNEANLLERVSANVRGAVTTTTFVQDIDYNAKGQRKLIDYGNGARTTYEYDPLTFRLMHLQTVRGTDRLQDLLYTYDPAGNITHIQDDAQQTIYFNNQVVEPHNDYIYDAIYQLISATGREHIGQISQPETTWNDEFRVNLVHPQDGLKMRFYTEQYEYDAVGNILQMIHQATNGNWTRAYAYNEASPIESGKVNNRLSGTTVGSSTESYTYDVHGNMTSMPHLPLMWWNYRNQLEGTAQQVVNSGSPETTYYVYDAGGQRVRKVTERQAAAGATPTRMKERIYLGGFEVYREYDSGSANVTLERETLHIMDGAQRIALVETKTIDTASPLTSHLSLIRFQLGNHLGSASLELDEEGRIMSYEEYYSYGSTSYQAVEATIQAASKRYRYTDKERDEETGLYYYGARYYIDSLGRWCSTDPSGISDDMNAYRYVRNNPMVGIDPNGKSTLPFILLLQSDNAKVDFNQVNGEPLLTPENVSEFWNSGGNNLVMGAIIFTGGAIVIIGTGGAATPFVLVSSGMAIGAGGIGMGAGAAELSLHAYGFIGDEPGKMSKEQAAEINRVMNVVMSAGSSPGSLLGAAGGGLYSGDLEGIETGAAIGGLVELGIGLKGLANSGAKVASEPGKVWQLSKDPKIALDNPVAPAGMDVAYTHGLPGKATQGRLPLPVELLARFAMRTNTERFLVYACLTACDAAAMQRLADRTNKTVGGFVDRVHASDNFLNPIRFTLQEVDVPDDLGRIRTIRMSLPEVTEAGDYARVVPVWFVPDEYAAQFYQMLRIGGYGVQQSEHVKDLIK
jgi:RHS repeat-associated protein